MFSSEKNLFTNFFFNVCLQVRFNSYLIAEKKKIRVLSQVLVHPNFQYRSRFPLPHRNPSSRASRCFKCVSVAGSFASHVSKVNNAIRVRAKVTGAAEGKADERRKLFSSLPFLSFSREIRRVSE